MTEKQLETYIRNFLKRNYDLELIVPVTFNGRLTRALGRFLSRRDIKEPVGLEFSKDLINTQDIDLITDVARHEAIHYALYMLDRPFHDGDRDFENELVKHNSKSTRTISITKRWTSYHLYKCECRDWKRRRAYKRGLSYSCPTCKGSLVYKGKVTS